MVLNLSRSASRVFLPVLIAAGISSSCFAQEKLKEVQSRAKEALSAGRAGEAAAILESALTADPGALGLLEILWKAYLETGKDLLAEEVADRIVHAFPERYPVRLWLAQMQEKHGRMEEAGAHYRALTGDPRTAPPEVANLSRLGLVRTLLAAGDPSGARRALEPLLGPAPRREAMLLELRAFREEGLLEQAIAAARLYQGVLPDGKERLASLLRQEGVEAFRAGDGKRATAALREAAGLLPTPPTMLDLALVLRKEDPAEAARLLEGLLPSLGPVESVAIPLAELHLESGRPEKALDLIQASPMKTGEARPAEVLRLKALAALRRGTELASEVKRLAGAHRSEPDWALPILKVVASLDEPQEAVEGWLSAAPPIPPEASPILARALRKAGDGSLRAQEASRAIRLYRQALELSPADGSLRGQLGLAQLKDGNPRAALETWEPVLRSGEASPEVLGAAARAIKDLGRTTEALLRARQAVKEAPGEGAISRVYRSLLDQEGLDEELLQSLDPDAVPQPDRREAPFVAAILSRRRHQAPFRKLLSRWQSKLPGEPALKRAEVEVLREEGGLARAAGDVERAASLYRSALDLEPRSVRDRAALITLLRQAGRFKEVRRALEQADPDLKEDPLLALEAAHLEHSEGRYLQAAWRARRLTRAGAPEGVERQAWLLWVEALLSARKLDEATGVLQMMARRDPRNERLLIRLYRTAFHAGLEDRAIEVLEELRERIPDSPAPRAVLIAHLLESDDLERARDLITGYLALAPGDVKFWNLLGEVDHRRGHWSTSREAFRSALRLSPDSSASMLGLARAEMALGNAREALAMSEVMLARNPHHHPARISRIKALESLGDLGGALTEWDAAFRMLPDHEFLFLRASLLSGKRRYREALSEIQKILDLAEEGSLPILLYHGVSRGFEADAVPAPLFRDQMRALKKAGYTAVSLEDVECWLRGVRSLPRRAVLITFDDARRDNLTVADPILKELGLRAVESVPTGLLEKGGAYYLGWSELRSMGSSGRWEFAAHGHLAHKLISIDASGSQGSFLGSRRWIAEEGRRETLAEMEARLDEDHRLSLEKLTDELGLKEVSAHAFPFGSLGQREVTDEPQAVPLNLRLLRKRFRRGFVQSPTGYNLRDRDLLLARFTVPEDWDGPKLIAHLRENEPRARARLERARILSWNGRIAESLNELELAAEQGASEKEVLRTRANALLWQGDRPSSEEAFRRLLELDPSDPRTLEALEKVERPGRPSVSGRLEYWWDRDDRSIFRQMARAEGNPLPRLRLHGEAGHATYREEGQEDLEALIAEVGAQASLQGPLEIEGALGEHWFDGARDAPHYSAGLRFGGLEWLRVEAGAAGGPVPMPRAVLEGIRLDTQSFIASFNISPDDRLSLSYRHGFYSDQNLRDTVRGEYSRRVMETPSVRLGYDGTFDDTRRDVPQYYSPQVLHLHRVFARLDASLGEQFWLTARLAGGYGWEDGEGRAVGNGSLQLRWLLGNRIELAGELSHLRNPRYWSSHAGLSLTLRF